MKKIIFFLFFFGVIIPEYIYLQNEEPPSVKPGLETTRLRAKDIGLQGNWRKKKDWLKQVVEKNTNIQSMVAKTQKFRSTFHDKFQAIDEELENFYRRTGFDRGEVSTLFGKIDKDLEKTKIKNKELFSLALSRIDESLKEEAEEIKNQYIDTYSIEEEFKAHKNNLAQLKLDTQSIIDLDKSIRERLKQADEQIKEIQDEAKQSQSLSKKIWDIIDDLKAREIFYNLSGIEEKAKSIEHYITKDLSEDFDYVIKTIREQIKKTGTAIDKLEKQGIIIMNRAKRLEENEEKQREILERKESEPKEEAIKRKRRKRRQPLSWWEWIISWFQW
jgi:DNA repair exonuclease SbcCD ATPase subunit